MAASSAASQSVHFSILEIAVTVLLLWSGKVARRERHCAGRSSRRKAVRRMPDREGEGRPLEEAAGVASGQTAVVVSSCVLELSHGELDTEARCK